MAHSKPVCHTYTTVPWNCENKFWRWRVLISPKHLQKWISTMGCHFSYTDSQVSKYIVACRPVARQQPWDKQIYNSCFWIMALQTSMFPWQHCTAIIERCFHCSPCWYVIRQLSMNSWSNELVVRLSPGNNCWRHGKLRRLYVCCGYSYLWSMQLSELL
jgi:hypothetical protein